jgi:hypothetical protein
MFSEFPAQTKAIKRGGYERAPGICAGPRRSPGGEQGCLEMLGPEYPENDRGCPPETALRLLRVSSLLDVDHDGVAAFAVHSQDDIRISAPSQTRRD